MKASWILPFLFHLFSLSNKGEKVLRCDSIKCSHDRVVTETNGLTLQVKYFRQEKVNWIFNFRTSDSVEYHFYQDSLTFGDGMYYDYSYLMFSPKDTSFTFNFDALDIPPFFPHGSNNWTIETQSYGDMRMTSRTNLLDSNFYHIYYYSYPFEINAIEESQGKGVISKYAK